MGKRTSSGRRRRPVLKSKRAGQSASPARAAEIQFVATRKTIQDVVEASQVETEIKSGTRRKMILWNFRLRPDQMDWLRKKISLGYNMNEYLRRLVDEEIRREENKEEKDSSS